MPEMLLRQPRCTKSSYVPFTRKRERIPRFIEAWDSKYIYQKALEKGCFQHEMADVDFRDLPRRIVSDKQFCGEIFNCVKNQINHGFQRGLVSMAYTFLDKKVPAAHKEKGTDFENL